MKVGPGHAAGFHVALDKLMPNEVGIGAVPLCEHAQVHNVLHTRFVCRVDERLALGEHRYGVAGQDEEPVDPRERDPERFGLVEIQVDGVLSFGPQPVYVGGPPRTRPARARCTRSLVPRPR